MLSDGDWILADLYRHTTCFDLTEDTLGTRCATGFALGVEAMMDTERDPTGSSWAPLSERYAEWKAARFFGQLMAHLYGVMKTEEQLLGKVEVEQYLVTQTFGTSEQAQQEAAWFSEGNANQPPRPFYDWNEFSEYLVTEILDQRFDDIFGP